MTARKYCRKPVEVEAMHVAALWHYTVGEVTAWCPHAYVRRTDGHLVVSTLDGEITVSPGDYIVRDERGEYKPCSPEDFADTYEHTPNTM